MLAFIASSKLKRHLSDEVPVAQYLEKKNLEYVGVAAKKYQFISHTWGEPVDHPQGGAVLTGENFLAP